MGFGISTGSNKMIKTNFESDYVELCDAEHIGKVRAIIKFRLIAHSRVPPLFSP